MLCILFVEPAATPSGELPVSIEHHQDTNMSNNLTRNDANCDKTGTCYDGNYPPTRTCTLLHPVDTDD